MGMGRPVSTLTRLRDALQRVVDGLAAAASGSRRRGDGCPYAGGLGDGGIRMAMLVPRPCSTSAPRPASRRRFTCTARRLLLAFAIGVAAGAPLQAATASGEDAF